MKRASLFLTLLLGFSSLILAQYEPAYQEKKAESTSVSKGDLPLFYIGGGTSLYGKYGFIGLNCAYRFAPKTIGEIHLGLGGWGSKAGFSITTHALSKSTWSPSIGFSRSGGGQNIPGSDIEVQFKSGGAAAFKVNTNLIYNPMMVMHVGVQRQMITRNKNRFVFELGYSLALSSTSVEFKDATVDVGGTTVPTALLEFSDFQNRVFKGANPAGIMIGLVYQWGFGKYE